MAQTPVAVAVLLEESPVYLKEQCRQEPNQTLSNSSAARRMTRGARAGLGGLRQRLLQQFNIQVRRG